jgi:hypothetical protein
MKPGAARQPGYKRVLLVLVALPALSVNASTPPCDTARYTLLAYDQAIALYEAEHGQLPAQDRWFEQLLQDGILLSAHRRNDPWGHPYVFRVRGATYDLRTVGPDGELDTDDDQTKDHDWRWSSCRHSARSWFHC